MPLQASGRPSRRRRSVREVLRKSTSGQEELSACALGRSRPMLRTPHEKERRGDRDARYHARKDRVAMSGADLKTHVTLIGYARVSTRGQDLALQLVVWRLDRLGRSLRHLVDIVVELQERQIAFRSLTEAIDTATPAGRLQLHLFAALAEFERELIRERSTAGREVARARGRQGGRPKMITAEKLPLPRPPRCERRAC